MPYWCAYHNRKVSRRKATEYCKPEKDCESLRAVGNIKKYRKLLKQKASFKTLCNWEGKDNDNKG